MDGWLKEITEVFIKSDDFFLQKDFMLDQPVFLFGIRSLIDLPKTMQILETHITTTGQSKNPQDELQKQAAGTIAKDKKQIIQAIIEGKLILFYPSDKKYLLVEPISKPLNRSIDLPSNENIVLGSHDSLIEDLDTNIGIVRKHLRSEFLHTRNFSIGTEQKKNVTILFMKNHVNQTLLRNITHQLHNNHNKDLYNSQDLIKVLGFSPWGIVSKYKSTELPLEIVHAIRTGKVILLVDGVPSALIFPNSLRDMFVLENDREFPIPLMLFIRFTRIIGVITATIIPGLYVALVSVNPEVLQIELALSIAKSREGVPYPALFEVLFMLIILELILEASIRLPKSIGSTVTMVGGIILGQAIISAKLVSNLLTIVIATTTIANSTVIGMQNFLVIRLFKYVVVILAAVYGVLGLLVGIVVICIYIASIEIFGIPFVDLSFSKDECNHE